MFDTPVWYFRHLRLIVLWFWCLVCLVRQCVVWWVHVCVVCVCVLAFSHALYVFVQSRTRRIAAWKLGCGPVVEDCRVNLARSRLCFTPATTVSARGASFPSILAFVPSRLRDALGAPSQMEPGSCSSGPCHPLLLYWSPAGVEGEMLCNFLIKSQSPNGPMSLSCDHTKCF